MNKKYDNNNIIITSRAYFLQDRLVEQQGFDLLWVQVTTFAECKKVSGYTLFQEGTTNAVGKEPIEALINLWRLMDIVLQNKSNLLKKCLWKLALLNDSLV
jgi:hypothetical protein